MAKKQQRNIEKNSLSIENNRYYKSDIYDTDPNQEDNFNY